MTPLRFASLFALTAVVAFSAEPLDLTRAEIIRLAAQAPVALTEKIVTVADKPKPAASGDIHDYISYARYYWPNPDTANGLPYVSRDGQHNRQQVASGDHPRVWTFCETVEKLAATWRVNRDETAALRAGEWLRAWFVTPATRMNPNLNFAQVRLGHNKDRGNKSGVLDTRCFALAIDAMLLLDDSPALTAAEKTAIRQWFTEYLHWLTTAENAIDEKAAPNNHGTWYLAHAIPVARFVGRDDVARGFCEDAKKLIASQIKPDGAQPEELRRVDGLGYSVFNLQAHFRVARHADALGIDIWNYTSPTGGSLRKALDFLRPYNAKPQAWPHNQNEKFEPGFLDELIKQGDAAWKKSS